MPNHQKPNRLTKRQSNQTAGNAASGDQSHSPPKEGAESHPHSHNGTEQHAKNQTDKNDAQQLQSSDTAAAHNLTSGHSKEESSRDNTGSASNQTATQSSSSGSSTDGTASNLLSSNLSLNTSLTAEKLTSASGKYLNGSHSSNNETLDSSYSLSNNKTTNATLPSELSSPTNSSSPVNLQSSTAEQQYQSAYHSKAKAVGISFGCLGAVLIISTAIFLMRKRLKGARSRSNDSNRAVRDRSSLEPAELGGSDPFACPSSFSKKPLILRPQSGSQLRNSFPRRPSKVSLRNHTIKSQISPPVIEPPSPGPRHPLYSHTPGNTNAGSSSKNHTLTSSPSWYSHRSGVSKTRNPYSHLGTVLSVKNPDLAAGGNTCGDNKIDTSLHSTPVPPRPPRPEWPILPFDSTGIKSYSGPVEEAGGAELPAILPLNVSRRSHRNRRNTFAGARHQSIEQIILESPESGQDSPTLPQYRLEQEIRSICSINDREPNPARASQLSRSTCYSQSSEAEIPPATAHNSVPDSKTPTELKFVSFGPTSSASSQLERQLDQFTSRQNKNNHQRISSQGSS